MALDTASDKSVGENIGPTTILLYHAIGGESEQPGRYVVPRRRFELQMAWLALTRRRVIGLEEVGRALEEDLD